MIKIELTAQRLREILDYNPATGEFTWKVARSRSAKPGMPAGAAHHTGYRTILTHGKKHSAHRLAWLYVHGEWPRGQIDHINGVRNDNRIINLRDVSASLNQQNVRRAQSNNLSGFLGVTRNGSGYQATINLNGMKKRLGQFKTAEAAHDVYMAAKRILHQGCPT